MRIFSILIFLICIMQSSDAQARRGLLFYGWYEDVEMISELPDTPQFTAENHKLIFGHKHTIYHVFYLPIGATSEADDFVLYRHQGSELLLYKPTESDLQAIEAHLNTYPKQAYAFNMMPHIWGWLIIIPGAFLAFAYYWLRDDHNPRSDTKSFADGYHEISPEFSHQHTTRTPVIPAQRIAESRPISSRPSGFGRRGL